MSSNKSVSTETTASVSVASTRSINKYPKKIFLYISPSTDDFSLWQLLESYGEVQYVNILLDKEGYSRGMAFAGFRWHEDAARALDELDGSAMDGMILHPRWATSRKQPIQQETETKRASDNGHRLKSLPPLNKIGPEATPRKQPMPEETKPKRSGDKKSSPPFKAIGPDATSPKQPIQEDTKPKRSNKSDHCLESLPPFRKFGSDGRLLTVPGKYGGRRLCQCKEMRTRTRTFCACSPGKMYCDACHAGHVAAAAAAATEED